MKHIQLISRGQLSRVVELTVCQLFVDIERDVDIQFDGRGGAYSLHPFPVNASSSSLGVWVRYADRGSTGTFLSMHMVK